MTAALATATPELRDALDELLLSLADDEFVIGFSDSEWTGIAPMLEEDVAMSSIAQDELGHAKALYELLAEVRADGGDADAIAYDRTPEEYRHCRLLDHARGDWAHTIVRRFFYDTADAVRLDALANSSYEPLRDLVAKIRREERYHRMHVEAWLDRLATREGEPRQRLLDALGRLAPDASTVLAALPGEPALVTAGVVDTAGSELDARWRAAIGPTFERLSLPMPPPLADPATARTAHSDAFKWLHGEFTSVRSLDPVATW